MSQEYFTIKNKASDEFTEKRSRFIGYIMPVTDEKQAVDFINEIKSRHWDAKHNVYAYVLRDGQIRRYSDDGEPQGTAGIPVLDVLLKENLTDCAVVVTRYFGGILLGGGGLVRAYSHAASLAVKAGQVIKMRLFSVCETKIDYTLYGKLPSLISKYGGSVTDTVFESDVTVTFKIPKDEVENFIKDYTNLSFGKASITIINEVYSEAL